MLAKKKRPPSVLRSKCLRAVSLLILGLIACRPNSPQESKVLRFSAEEKALIQSLTGLPPLPANPSNHWADNPQAARFGQKLFYDTRLSLNGQLSCASCHHPGLGWSDGKPRAVGLKQTVRNSPTLWNTAQQRWFFWDGRADSLWAQAIQPLESLAEMGMSRTGLLQRFARERDLRQAYEALFGPLPSVEGLPPQARPVPEDPRHPLQQAWQKLSPARQDAINRFVTHITKSLEAFERRIQSGESPFDRFARGIKENRPELQQELSLEAQKGLRLFIGRGQCILCHTGPLLSDREFHNLGLPKMPDLKPDPGRYQGIPLLLADPFNGLGPYSDLVSYDDPWNDKLLYLKRQASNQGEFKTPSLREISRTAPYMHDGRFQTLAQVVQFYAQIPSTPPAVGRREDTLQQIQLKPEEIPYLVAFLQSLTGPEPPLSLVGPPAQTP